MTVGEKWETSQDYRDGWNDALSTLWKDLDKERKSERKFIGELFSKWFNDDGSELIEDAIERITGVKISDPQSKGNV